MPGDETGGGGEVHVQDLNDVFTSAKCYLHIAWVGVHGIDTVHTCTCTCSSYVA